MARASAFAAELTQHNGFYCQCAWCGRYETAGGAYVQLPGLALPSGLTSHTVCPICAPALFAEARRLHRTRPGF